MYNIDLYDFDVNDTYLIYFSMLSLYNIQHLCVRSKVYKINMCKVPIFFLDIINI